MKLKFNAVKSMTQLFAFLCFLINTSQETERQCQLSLGIRIREIDWDCRHSHIFEYKWNLKLVCLALQEAARWKDIKTSGSY